jgi:PAS domain S-box-containing protein
VTPQSGVLAQAIVDAALDAVVVMDEAGCVRGWNRAAERIFGYRTEQALGRELAELIVPGPLRDAHRNALGRYLETHESTIMGRRVELVARRHDDTEIPVELTVLALPGAPTSFAGFVRPLEEAALGRRETVRLQKRMAFLAQAGLALDRSLELEETLRRLADITVPELAQLTVIDLVSPSGQISTAVACALEDEHARELEQVRQEYPLDVRGGHPVALALRTGESHLLSEMSTEYQREIAQGDEHFQLMRRLRYHSAVVVPLVARRRVLGALSLLRMEDAPSFDPDDLVLAEDLARRAALAIDNARLFEATRHLARTLQESLLPSKLPRIEGVQLGARYRAAAQGQEVGGDFYDAFALADGRWGIVVGDVRGKGPRAAALTSQARYTIRALCDRGSGAVLEMLNQAVHRDSERLPERFLTAVVAVLERRENGLAVELAAAGHPPPLILRADGSVQETAACGILIGVNPSVTYEPQRLELAPGESLVLYTDGLTDARAPERILSERDLSALVSRGRGLDAPGLAGFLETNATDGGDPRDDIAILVVQVAAAPAPAGPS